MNINAIHPRLTRTLFTSEGPVTEEARKNRQQRPGRRLRLPAKQAARVLAFALFGLVTSHSMAETSADAFYQEAQRLLGAEDVTEALRLFRQAAAQGHADAMARIGLILDGAEENAAALEWYTKSANAGSAEGMLWLSEMYYKGEAAEPDFTKGAHWLRQAADAGLANAKARLADAYERGRLGMSVDTARALAYWRQAAALDDPNALQRMARAYRTGELGLTPDENQAAQLEARMQ